MLIGDNRRATDGLSSHSMPIEVVAFDIERRFPELRLIREWRNPHSAMAFYLYAWSP
ncbi:MAG: hypothetical protein RMJ48_19455 [Roseiflexaceae bacterium]|nr:hypothetical protein [Roseiflexaceae bacterium]